jgi:HK97 family phage major capsid protein
VDPVKTERERSQAITAIANEHGFSAKAGEWIASGKAVAEVNAEILAHYKRNGTPPVKVPDAGEPMPVARGVADRGAKQPYASLGEQLQDIVAVSGGNAVPRGGLAQAKERLMNITAAASGGSATSGPDGGFLIQKDFTVDLMKDGFETGVLSSRCSETPIGANADGLEVSYVDETSRATGSRWGGVQIYRAAEAETVTSKKVKIGKWECRLEDLMGLAYLTERLMQDAPAMGNVFQEAFRDEFGFVIDDEIYRGTGAGQCMGVLNAGCTVSQAKEVGQINDTIVAENIINMWSRVPLRSRLRGIWVYNLEAEPQLQQMVIGVGASAQPVYMPPGGLSQLPYGTIYGRPAIPLEQASAIGDVGDIAFLDLTKYKLITKGGIQADESIHVRFINNERTFRWVARVNGAPKIKSALTPYKGTNTLSPFVVLAAR